jgi:hypothetical protein
MFVGKEMENSTLENHEGCETIILWRAHCETTESTKEVFVYQATMEATSVFFVVRSGDDVMQQ